MLETLAYYFFIYEKCAGLEQVRNGLEVRSAEVSIKRYRLRGAKQ